MVKGVTKWARIAGAEKCPREFKTHKYKSTNPSKSLTLYIITSRKIVKQKRFPVLVFLISATFKILETHHFFRYR
jgi:chloramphenicol O-acetyltransferase